MKKYIKIILSFTICISNTAFSIFFILMLFDSLLKRSNNFKLFELSNPFSGKYLFPFLIFTSVSLVLIFTRSFLQSNNNKE
jgi:hypothetical protein